MSARHSRLASRDDRKDAELATVMGAALDEVISPDVTGIFWAKPDALPVIQPKPTALGLLLRDLQSLAPPDTFDPFAVHRPPRAAQQRRYPTIAIASVLPGQRDDVFGQGLLVVSPARHDALRRSMLPEHPAYSPLGRRQQLPDMIDTTPPPRGLRSFPVQPPAISACRASGRRSPGVAAHSSSQDSSSAAPGQSSDRHILSATDSRSAR